MATFIYQPFPQEKPIPNDQRKITIDAATKEKAEISLRQMIRLYFPDTMRHSWHMLSVTYPAPVVKRIYKAKPRALTRREKEILREVYRFRW